MNYWQNMGHLSTFLDFGKNILINGLYVCSYIRIEVVKLNDLVPDKTCLISELSLYVSSVVISGPLYWTSKTFLGRHTFLMVPSFLLPSLHPPCYC